MIKLLRVYVLSVCVLLSLGSWALSAESLTLFVGTYTQPKGSEGIYRAELNLDTGALSEPELAVKAKNPSFVEIHPNGKTLYAVSEAGGTGSVSAYAIDANAGLTFLNQQPSGGSGPCHVNVDRSGHCVFVANYGSGSASSIPVLPNGALGEPASVVQHTGSSVNPSRQEGPHAHSVNVTPDNALLLVADLGIDKVMLYQLDSDSAKLTPNDPPFIPLKPGTGPRHLVFSPNGQTLYVIGELSGTVTVFAYTAATKTFTKIQTVTTLPKTFQGANKCAEVRVHPTGKFLYGSNRGHNSIVVYRIDPNNGMLCFAQHQTKGIKTPRNFNIDPTGRYCLVANQDGNSIIVFRIDLHTGKLIPTGHKITVADPVCIRFLKR